MHQNEEFKKGKIPSYMSEVRWDSEPRIVLNLYLKVGMGETEKTPSQMSEVLINIASLGLVMNIHLISSIIPSMTLLIL